MDTVDWTSRTTAMLFPPASVMVKFRSNTLNRLSRWAVSCRSTGTMDVSGTTYVNHNNNCNVVLISLNTTQNTKQSNNQSINQSINVGKYRVFIFNLNVFFNLLNNWIKWWCIWIFILTGSFNDYICTLKWAEYLNSTNLHLRVCITKYSVVAIPVVDSNLYLDRVVEGLTTDRQREFCGRTLT